MKFLENTKIYIGKKILQNKASNKKRIVKACNVNDAKSIGIIYNATHLVSFEIIKEFTKSLIASNKVNVSALGYVHSKKLIDHYLYRKGFDFFTKNDLNWYRRPFGSIIEDFIKKPFDILINLSLQDYYPIQYVVALSESTFKTGCYDEKNIALDFMINIEKEKQVLLDLKKEITGDKKENGKNKEIEKEIDKKVEIEIQLNFLITQLTHYLSIIKYN